MHTLTHRLRLFAHQHDDIPAFHAAYLVTTFLVAAVFSLGYFAILIVLHMMLDYVKYRDYFRFPLRLTLKAMMLESIVDIALLCLSLTLSVYLSTGLALSLVSGVFRSSLTLIAALGTIIPKIHILEHLLAVFLDVHSYMYTPHADIRRPLSKINKIALGTIIVTVLLLLLSIALFHGREAELLDLILSRLSLKL